MCRSALFSGERRRRARLKARSGSRPPMLISVRQRCSALVTGPFLTSPG
jgi:hypothetical protein